MQRSRLKLYECAACDEMQQHYAYGLCRRCYATFRLKVKDGKIRTIKQFREYLLARYHPQREVVCPVCKTVRYTRNPAAKYCGVTCASEVLASARLETAVQSLRSKLVGVGVTENYKRLSLRQRDIIRRRLGGDSLRAIGQHYRLTRERIRQIQDRAIQLLQGYTPSTGGRPRKEGVS